MRDIHFRGRDIKSGDYVYGQLSVNPLLSHEVYIVSRSDGSRVRVSTDSVGQYSGLCDNKNNRIYDGDTIRWLRDGRLYVICFRSGMFYARIKSDGVHGGFPLWVLCANGDGDSGCEIVND